MEEKKKKEVSFGQKPDIKLVEKDLEYLGNEVHEADTGLTKEQYKNTRPKITVSLSKSITLYKENAILPPADGKSIANIEIKSIEEAQLYNSEDTQNGNEPQKPIILRKKDIQILYALSIYIARWGADPTIEEYVRKLSIGERPGIRITRLVDIDELASIILMTPANKVREREREEVHKRLVNLTKIRQHIKLRGNVFDEEEGYIPNQPIEYDDQYLGSVGAKFKYPNRTGDLHYWVEIVFSDLFFYNLLGVNSRFAPIPPSIMVIRDVDRTNKKGKVVPGKELNNTEVFWKVFSLLNAERWRFVSKGVADARKGAEDKIKEDGIKNYGLKQKRIKEAVEKGLVYVVPVKKILGIISDSYTSNYKRMSKKGAKGDFWVELNNTLKALKVIGYLDKDSFIEVNEDTPTESKVYFVYNREYEKLPKFNLPTSNNNEEDNE